MHLVSQTTCHDIYILLYNKHMENNYFNEALHNFTSDYAYRGQIRHLFSLGLCTSQIKDKLDFPVPFETVKSYLWDYLLSSKQVVFSTDDIVPEYTTPKYILEYDSYGRKSFRLEGARPHNTINYSKSPLPNNIYDIPNLYTCFIEITNRLLSSCKTLLSPSQLEYLDGFPWPQKDVYFKINEKMADIIASLLKAGIRPEAIISPTSQIIYF